MESCKLSRDQERPRSKAEAAGFSLPLEQSLPQTAWPRSWDLIPAKDPEYGSTFGSRTAAWCP